MTESESNGRNGLNAMQIAMLDECMESDRHWLTASWSQNAKLLEEWVTNGWAVRTDPPVGAEKLASYAITDAGKEALKASA